MFAEQIAPPGPDAMRALRRASRSRSVPRETRDRLVALFKYLEVVLAKPLVAQRTGKAAVALADARLHVVEFFGTELGALLPRLLDEDKDGSLHAWLRGDTTMAEDTTNDLAQHVRPKERRVLGEAWRAYVAGMQLLVRAARVQGDEPPTGEAWERLRKEAVRTDALFLPLLLVLGEAHAKPTPAVRRALIEEFKARADRRYDAAKAFAASVVNAQLDADGQTLAALATDAPQPDLTMSPAELFARSS